MSVSMYQASVPVFIRGLRVVSALLEKAQAHVEQDGIVLAVGALGAVLAMRTAASFDRLAWLHGLKASPEMIGRIVAGNAADAFGQLPPALRAVAQEAARQAFIDGFASVLYLAGALAAVVAALVFVLARPALPAPQGARKV